MPATAGPSQLAFRLLCVTTSLMTAAASMMAVMVPLYATFLGLGPQWLGVLIALPGIFPVLLALQAGRWVDGYGPARWLLFGMVGMMSAPAVLLIAPGVPTLAVSRLLVGVTVLFVNLAAQSLVASMDNRRSHQSNFAAYSTWQAGGRMVGPILMGVVIDGAGFRLSFLAVLVVIALGAGLSYFVYRAVGSEPVEGSREVVGARKMLRATVRNVGFRVAVLASAGIFLALTVREAFLPVMLEQLGMSATVIGALVSLGSLTSVLIRPLMPLVTRLLKGTGRSLVVAMATVAVGIGLLALVKSVFAFALLAVLVGFGTGIGFPLSIVAVASHVPLRQRGMALGLRLSTSHLVEISVPILSGLLVAATSYAVGFAGAGLVLAVLTVLAFKLLPRFEAAEIEALTMAAEVKAAADEKVRAAAAESECGSPETTAAATDAAESSSALTRPRS